MWEKIIETIIKRLKHTLFYLFSFVGIIIVIFAKDKFDKMLMASLYSLTIIVYVLFVLTKRKPERIDEKKKKLIYLRDGLERSIEKQIKS